MALECSYLPRRYFNANFPFFFHNLTILLFSEIVIFMIKVIIGLVSSISVCNHIRDKQVGLPLRVRPILLSLGYLDAIRIYVIPVILPKESNTYIPKRLRRSMHMKCGDVNLQQQLVCKYRLLTNCEVRVVVFVD